MNKTLISRIEFSQLSWEVPTENPYDGGHPGGGIPPTPIGGEWGTIPPSEPLESVFPQPGVALWVAPKGKTPMAKDNKDTKTPRDDKRTSLSQVYSPDPAPMAPLLGGGSFH